MMRSMIVAGAMLALGVGAAPSVAQQSDGLAEAATKLYSACIANKQGGPTECACVAGFFAGRLKEDEYRIIGTINKYIDATGNVPDMAGAQAAAEAERVRLNMTRERYAEVMRRFSTMDADGAYADRACVAVAAVPQ